MPNKHLRVVTTSELRTRRRCAREHHIAYELGIRPIESAHALRFGTLIHTGLEAWWLAPSEERLQWALAALPLDADPFDLARATEMLRGYDIRWRDEPLEVVVLKKASEPHNGDWRINPLLAVEIEFHAPLANPATDQRSQIFELGGKLDALVRDLRDHRIYVVEHKTSSEDFSPGSDYSRVLALDAQVSAYYAGTRALGFEPAGVIYDVLGKPQLRPKHATPIEDRQYRRDGRLYASQREHDETADEFQLRVREAIAEDPDRYYTRATIVRFDEEETDFGWDTWHTARGIHLDGIARRWPKNPDACRRYGRMCSYFDVCTKTTTLDDPTRFRRVDNVHEELVAVVQPPESSQATH